MGASNDVNGVQKKKVDKEKAAKRLEKERYRKEKYTRLLSFCEEDVKKRYAYVMKSNIDKKKEIIKHVCSHKEAESGLCMAQENAIIFDLMDPPTEVDMSAVLQSLVSEEISDDDADE